jgi:hypothetical protein
LLIHSRLSWLAALLLLSLSACTSQPTGSVQLAASVQQALSASDVTRVTVTVSAPGMTSLSVDLAQSNGSWGGLISDLPSGTSRSFLAQAFDSSNTLLFQGSASGVSIPPNQTTAVALTLQQVSPTPPYGNEAPLIDSVVASSTSVQAGGALSLIAEVHDPNTGDTLSLAWSATAGSFSDSSSASTTWTAPSSISIQTLTLTVTDSQGSTVSLSFAINVTSGLSTNADLQLSFNLWPSVSKVSASLSRLDAGQSTSVSSIASDADGDALSYQWTASCPGTWTNPTSSSASFIPSSVPAGPCNNCRLTLTVQDGRGGLSSGFVNLCVAAASSTQRFAPLFTDFQQSVSSISPGQTVSFDVTASDPQASALTFAWTTNTGSLASAQSTATTSSVAWTAPSCAVRDVSPSVTATVINAYGRSTSITFAPVGLPTCASGWASAGALAAASLRPTATLLSSGKVLVAGGYNGSSLSAAALYDPATGTWSTTGSMASPRFTHPATLLPNGKVLVSGAFDGRSGVFPTSELYDPATGTWSAAAPMTSPRSDHMATLLSNGKVLVSGGFTWTTLNSAELYDPASDTWSTTASMASHRWRHTTTLLPNGKVLVSGGFIAGNGSSAHAAAEVYDPALGTWSTTAPMASPRGGHMATLLPNGKVLVLGGSNGSSTLSSAEVYDPASGTWRTVASMASPHIDHAATLLPSGKVLVSGSGSGPGPALSAEVYDPASDTWSTAASMTSPRGGHTATLLPNGKVLVSGGHNGSYLASAELYTP